MRARLLVARPRNARGDRISTGERARAKRAASSLLRNSRQRTRLLRHDFKKCRGSDRLRGGPPPLSAYPPPSRIRRSRDVGAYLGLVPKRYQSGEVDYVGGISKCGDRRVRTLLYEAANVMLTCYNGQLKLKDWAFAIARRSTMRKARVALAGRLAIIMHARLGKEA